mmetsp:Transcript_43262/g.85936  ORF Transcript_43262/g.85936 Transcript_43262/m.85936 type:complete len:210 (-) Transcript_43262:166-795(-)
MSVTLGFAAFFCFCTFLMCRSEYLTCLSRNVFDLNAIWQIVQNGCCVIESQESTWSVDWQAKEDIKVASAEVGLGDTGAVAESVFGSAAVAALFKTALAAAVAAAAAAVAAPPPLLPSKDLRLVPPPFPLTPPPNLLLPKPPNLLLEFDFGVIDFPSSKLPRPGNLLAELDVAAFPILPSLAGSVFTFIVSASSLSFATISWYSLVSFV